MKHTDFPLCPNLYTKEDVPDYNGRLFRNLAILESRLIAEGESLVSAQEVVGIIREIMEV